MKQFCCGLGGLKLFSIINFRDRRIGEYEISLTFFRWLHSQEDLLLENQT